jgi:hypothetical protein
MWNRAFAIFSSLWLYEEQRIRRLRILENLDDRMPKHFVDHFCTLADASVFLNFGRTL